MAYKASRDPRQDVTERLYVPELLRGLAITTRHFLRNLFGNRDANPEVQERTGTSLVTTVQYPEEKVEYPPGYRGLHRLVPREDGKPRCVACYMCATVCPAQCIYIEAGEYDAAAPEAESRVIEKFPTKFVIDELRCIVCGLCVEACPKDAIRMDTGTHSKPAYTRAGFALDIYNEAGHPELLQGPAVSHPSDPWTRRDSSEAPAHPVKEAHTRAGEGDVRYTPDGGGHDDAHALPAAEARALPEGASRTQVDTSHPVPVTRFLK
jgi:NADH-quinone oxidoreductase subunit I